MEYLLVHRGGRGQCFAYELLYQGEGDEGEPFVMGLDRRGEARLRRKAVRAKQGLGQGSVRPWSAPGPGVVRVPENGGSRSGQNGSFAEIEPTKPLKTHCSGRRDAASYRSHAARSAPGAD